MKYNFRDYLEKVNVVGVIASEDDLFEAMFVGARVDFFEIRLDKFDAMKYWDQIRRLEKPLIITARDFGEGGGQPSWTIIHRLALYRMWMPLATFIDVEATNVNKFSNIVAEAHSAGVGVIISFHSLQSMPTSKQILSAYNICCNVNGDVLKLAVNASCLKDVGEFIDHIVWFSDKKIKLAPMLAGSYGRGSRLLFAELSFVFIYGYLKTAQVNGQWHACVIKDLIEAGK